MKHRFRSNIKLTAQYFLYFGDIVKSVKSDSTNLTISYNGMSRSSHLALVDLSTRYIDHQGPVPTPTGYKVEKIIGSIAPGPSVRVFKR